VRNLACPHDQDHVVQPLYAKLLHRKLSTNHFIHPPSIPQIKLRASFYDHSLSKNIQQRLSAMKKTNNHAQGHAKKEKKKE
jgi:hypothetical protein